MTPDEILADLGEIYRRKNEDYGDSWRITGRILHTMADGDSISIESVDDWIRVGLYTRRLDKIVRSFHAEMVSGGDVHFEAVRDTHEDESVYAAMHASTHEKGSDDDAH